MEELLKFAIKLDTLLEEYDEWERTITTLDVRKDLYTEYSIDSSDTVNTLSEIENYYPQAVSMRDGCLRQLVVSTYFDNIHDIRKFVIELKTLLNIYSERVSSDFIESRTLNDLTQEDLIQLSKDLLGRGNE